MTQINFLNIVIDTLTHDLLRYVLGAGGVYLIVNVALAGPLRPHKIRPQTPGWDQIRREIVTSLRTVGIFAITGICIALLAQSGLTRIYTDSARFGTGWIVASTVLIILAHDTWFYWTHRAMHRPRLYRLLHRLHHTSHNPTPFTSYNFDIGEAVINAIFLPLWLILVPMHPTAILVFLVHMMLRNALAHCGYELFPARRDGRPLFGWLTSVTHHDQHHANARYNHGFYFTWWDRWMGTQHPEYEREFARAARPLRRPRTVASALGIIAALVALAPFTPLRAEPLRGTYAAPGLSMVVRFGPCESQAGQSCGRLLWAWDTDTLRHVKPGDLVVTGLQDGDGEWTDGRLIQPRTGHSYRGRIRPLPGGNLLLQGCAGPICERQTWRPLSDLRRQLAGLE